MSAWTDYLRKIRMNPNPPPMEQEWLGRSGSWLGNINPAYHLPNEGQYAGLRRRFPGPDYKDHPGYRQWKRGAILEKDSNLGLQGFLGDALIPMRASSGASSWGETYGANNVSTDSLDPGLASGETGVAKPSKGGKWKKIIEQLGKMTGPEPDWSLSAKKMGVPSPWSPTNVAWSPVGADMFGRKKKKGPY